LDGERGPQHVLYERDDDVVFVRVDQTRFGLCVASPMEILLVTEKEKQW
jgi:hypothetical protein